MTTKKNCIRFIRAAFMSCILSCVITAQAQRSITLKPLIDTIKGPFNYATLSSIKATSRKTGPVSKIPGVCNTSTFYIHLNTAPGEQVELAAIQTLPSGDYVLAGTLTATNGEKQGFVTILSNEGTLLSQQKFRLNNFPVTVSGMTVLVDGSIIISGVYHASMEEGFVVKMNPDLSIVWTQIIDLPTAPTITTISSIQNNELAFAAQCGTNVIYSTLNSNGLVKWSRQVNLAGLNKLVGFTQLAFTRLGLVGNCTITGMQQSVTIQIDQASGNLLSSHFYGSGGEEELCGEVKSYSERQISLRTIQEMPGAFKAVRGIAYSSANEEIQHTYTIPGNINFSTTMAMDNAGDAMAFCLGADGTLIFAYQFAYYQTSPRNVRSYQVPVGSEIKGVSRSFIDGGYIFGLNTTSKNELILIKTDSTGILAGCTYSDLQITSFTQSTTAINTPITLTANSITLPQSTGNLPGMAGSLSLQTDCNQLYCPAPPTEDTCLSTYFKTFRSNSYADRFDEYFMAGNNQHIVLSNRNDRILGNMNQVSYGMKLFDENGKYIKGLTIYHDGVSKWMTAKRVDKDHIMLVAEGARNNLKNYTLTLMNNDLQPVWTKSVECFANYNFLVGQIYGDIIADKQGNFYLIASRSILGGPSTLLIYKMDPLGNPLWVRTYANQGIYYNANATATNTSIVVFFQSHDRDLTLEVDQMTGNVKHGYRFENTSYGSVYRQLMTFNGSRILYAGNDRQSNLLLASFDTTGKPLQLKIVQGIGAPRAGIVENNTLYAACLTVNNKQALLKADTSLKIEFAKEYNFDAYAIPTGIGIGNNGSIYLGGNHFYTSSDYQDPMLQKYDENGVIGTCNSTVLNPLIVDINPGTVNESFTSTVQVFTPITLPVSFVPDEAGQEVNAILCSSSPQCTDISVSGPTAVCTLNTPVIYKGNRNAGCTLQPLWIYDTAFVKFESEDADSIQLSFKKTGTTHIIARLNAGCGFYSDTIEVNIQSNPALISLGNDRILCPGDALQLDAGAGFQTYQWQDGSAASVFMATAPGQYFVQVSNICGDQASDTVIINPALVPALSIGNDRLVCQGEIHTIQATAGFVSYEWQASAPFTGQGQEISLTPLFDQSVSLMAATADGCKAYDTIVVNTKFPKPVSLGNDTSLCRGQSLQLSAGTGYTQYNWSTGSSASAINVSGQGSYWVNATDVNGCIARDTLSILQVYPLPSPKLGPDKDLCYGTKLVLNPGSFNLYQWQDGSSGSQFIVNTTGTYWVQVKDQHQCMAGDTMVIKAILPNPQGFLNPVDTICQYDQFIIKPVGSFSSYVWSNGSMQPSITIEQPGMYILKVTDAKGCAGNDTTLIVQKICYTGIFIPTAFTPNGDQRNDQFKALVYGPVISFRLQVYNRWGEIVFSTTDHRKGWDGKVNGVPTDTNTFVWQCYFQLQGEEAGHRKGTVTLIR